MARRRLLQCVLGLVTAVFVLAVAGGAVLVAPAKAGVSPAPYQDTTYNADFWNIVKSPEFLRTSTWSPSDWAALEGFDVATAAGTMPAVLTLGAGFVVGAVGLDIGWKIGRTIDTKWLHLSDSTIAPYSNPTIASVSVTFDTFGDGSGSSWAGAPCDVTKTYLADSSHVGCVNLQANFVSGGVSGAPYSCPGVNTTVSPFYCSAQTVAAYAALSSRGWGTEIHATAGTDCRNDGLYGTVCRHAWVMSEAQAESRIIHSAPQAYSNQTVNKTTTMNPAPSASPTSAGLSAARSASRWSGAVL